MPEAVATRPVPIRLAYRYPNGSMVSYSARALSHDESSVRIVVNEEFETGISLAVMAPFLEGLTTGRVSAVTRSKKQPGYFEMVLCLGEGSASGPVASDLPTEAEAPAEKLSGESRPQGREISGTPEPAAEMLPAAAGIAAEQMADLLSIEPPRRWSEVLAGMAPESRSVALPVAIAATLHLLEQKGAVQARRLVSGAKEAGGK